MNKLLAILVTSLAFSVQAAAPAAPAAAASAAAPAAKCDPVKDKTCKVEEKKDAKAAPAAAPAKK